MVLDLHEYQERALMKIEEAEKVVDRGVVAFPTASGKTRLSLAWILRKLQTNPDLKVCFFAHNRDLLTQARSEFESQGLKCSYYVGHKKDISQITFASTQTMYLHINDFDSKFFDYIISDEAHHNQARTFRQVILHFSPKFMLGLTATPFRTDGKNIFNVCGDLIDNAEIYDMIAKGILCQFVYESARDNIDWNKARWNGHTYDESDLNKLLSIREYDEAIFDEYLFHRDDQHRKKTLAFCCTVEHAHRMANYFNSKGVSAVAFTRTSPSGVNMNNVRRTKIIENFKAGLYDIIFTVNLFNEGMSVSAIDFIMMLRPTQSSIMFTQQVGRGLRNAVGKDYCLIVDYSGNAHKCSVVYDFLEDALHIDFDTALLDDKNRISRRNNELLCVSNGCKVYFDRTKIDLFHKNSRIKIDEDFVINDYLRCKQELGRIPVCRELYQAGKFVPILFGSYTSLLLRMGELPKDFQDHKVYSDDELRDNYFAVKSVLGRVPNKSDFDKSKGISKLSSNKYLIRFGSWHNIHKVYGDVLNRQGNTILNVDKNDLFLKYYQFLIKKGLSPTSYDISKGKSRVSFGIGIVTRLFGGYTKFRVEFLDWMNVKGLSLDTPPIVRTSKRKCIRCGKPALKGSKFCSNDCKNRRVKVACSMCGKEFERRHIQKGTKLFCSPKCRYKSVEHKTVHSFVHIVRDYVPINVLPEKELLIHNNAGHSIIPQKVWNREYVSSSEKDKIRSSSISRIKDGDVVLLLESPKLLALKEIVRQGKKPSKVIIPNNFEFNEMSKALSDFNPDFDVFCLNTSALQLIIDKGHIFDFAWLDYCGGFSSYKEDVNQLLSKVKKPLNLFVTFCLFDFQKKDDTDYIIQVSNLIKSYESTLHWGWILDVSRRYKKNMYNLGFIVSPKRKYKVVDEKIVKESKSSRRIKLPFEEKEIYEYWNSAEGRDKEYSFVAIHFGLFYSNGNPNKMIIKRILDRYHKTYIVEVK